MYKVRAGKLTCECGKWKVDMEEQGVKICDCGKYTYSHTWRPHECGCRGKKVFTKSISYGKIKDIL